MYKKLLLKKTPFYRLYGVGVVFTILIGYLTFTINFFPWAMVSVLV